ncbi:hypothetical protein CERZMDRAFT_114413 [Cercospora zeae-maydis SCOH1-5]|uniref:ORC6 first cyclin-like domain-containing protein n=1 Tax=Cercospora zeae-maydis SCOH1-5 TaxID=717836 RepID=A0A6A6F625_9PEZI|nr:hypothetical protein CERZMDRAFT_114413 [Cercospora zeae-maydis SCOH1-5]
MPSPTETALSTLLPTASFLPPDLVSLANSLLAQSRSKAASLKPEEEIGRVYACAHIAAERLKKRLDLEIEKPKPPCPPRVYGKLYVYLDGALSMPRTPRAERKRDAIGSGGDRMLGESRGASVGSPKSGRRGVVGVDVGGSSGTKLKTPSASGMKRSRGVVEEGRQENGEDEFEGIPSFIMPLVRQVCKATKTPKAVPHVVVGAKAVVREIASRVTKRSGSGEPVSKRRRMTPQSAAKRTNTAAAAEVENAEDAVALEKWPALVVALLLFTVARMGGMEVDSEEIAEIRKEACEAVELYVISNAADLPEELGKVAIRSLKKPVDFYMLEAEDCGWLDMEWYRNVPENIDEVEQHEEDAEVEDEDEGEEAVTPRKRPTKTPLRRKEKHGGKAALPVDGLSEDDVGAAGILPGLGTMFQPAIDWLSDERRADYSKWKQSILKECATIEAKA